MCIYGVGVWWDGPLGNTLAYIHGADCCSLLSFGIFNTTIQILRRYDQIRVNAVSDATDVERHMWKVWHRQCSRRETYVSNAMQYTSIYIYIYIYLYRF